MRIKLLAKKKGTMKYGSGQLSETRLYFQYFYKWDNISYHDFHLNYQKGYKIYPP